LQQFFRGWAGAIGSLRKLLRHLCRILAELKDELSDYLFVTLTAAVGKEYFYRKQGWSHQKSAFMAPRSEKQKRDHAFED
jgi:hypothetical protein